MSELGDGSVDCVFTSPPYWGLRDYGHPEQVGNESTTAQYIASLLDVFDEVRRVVKPTGSAWVLIGDTYRCKSLALVPECLAVGLAAQGWIIRNVVIWRKTDPLPESVRDRLARTHERRLHLVRSRHYYYDLDAVRVAHRGPAHCGGGAPKHRGDARHERLNGRAGFTARRSRAQHPVGKNPGDVFECATSNYPGRHFATLPVELATPRILSTTPRAGWVLDPFAGVGSVGVAALRCGRRFVGYEINPQYAALATRRLRAETRSVVQRVRANGAPFEEAVA